VNQIGVLEFDAGATPAESQEFEDIFLAKLSAAADTSSIVLRNPDSNDPTCHNSDQIQVEHASQNGHLQHEQGDKLSAPKEIPVEACAPADHTWQPEAQISNDRRPSSFIVTIIRSDDLTPLGLEVFQDLNRRVRVRKLRAGLISQWNAANPVMQIKERDHIKAINGVGSDLESMMAAALEGSMLQFLISPGEG